MDLVEAFFILSLWTERDEKTIGMKLQILFGYLKYFYLRTLSTVKC